MKRTLTALAIAAALALTGCSSAAPEVQAAPDAPTMAATTEAATTTPATDRANCNTNCPDDPYSFFGPGGRPTPKVDVASEDTFTFDDGLKVTFNSATVAPPEQVGSDPVEGMTPVTLSFTYVNGGSATIPLQQVPFTVMYGADLYPAKQPTLYNGDPSHTELPAQISPGSTVEAVNTYWVPAGEPITVLVNINGPDEPERVVPMFWGITVS